MAATSTSTGTRTAGDQVLSPIDALTQLSFRIQGLLDVRAREYELSLVQVRLLGVLRDRNPTMNEVAKLLGLEKSSATGLVDRAERRGLVKRVPSSTDGRAVLVTLTTDGRSLIAQAGARFGDDVADLLASLPPADRDALVALVTHLLVADAGRYGVDLFPRADP
jgi:MarR family transcriptional regulator, lower aerobic nicotinate degradation pathway regulator